MTNYKQERNRDKWLAFVVALIVIATILLTIKGAVWFYGTVKTESYHKGYRKAKLTYQCDHDNTECEILKD